MTHEISNLVPKTWLESLKGIIWLKTKIIIWHTRNLMYRHWITESSSEDCWKRLNKHAGQRRQTFMLLTMECLISSIYLFLLQNNTWCSMIGNINLYQNSEHSKNTLTCNTSKSITISSSISSHSSNCFGIKYFNPIAIRIFNECYPLHFSCNQWPI